MGHVIAFITSSALINAAATHRGSISGWNMTHFLPPSSAPFKKKNHHSKKAPFCGTYIAAPFNDNFDGQLCFINS